MNAVAERLLIMGSDINRRLDRLQAAIRGTVSGIGDLSSVSLDVEAFANQWQTTWDMLWDRLTANSIAASLQPGGLIAAAQIAKQIEEMQPQLYEASARIGALEQKYEAASGVRLPVVMGTMGTMEMAIKAALTLGAFYLVGKLLIGAFRSKGKE